MTQFGAWEIGADDTPRRLDTDREFLEEHLENWIQNEPSLLSGDVRWVRRQLILPDQSRLDLLGLTRDGVWVIAELKAGSVGVDTVRQAFHYFLELALLDNAGLVDLIRRHPVLDQSVEPELDLLADDPDDRDRGYMLLVAGVGTGELAQDAASVLAGHGFDVPVRVVTFQLLRDEAGRRILIREVDDDDTREPAQGPSGWSLDDLLELAERFGVRSEFEQIRNGLLERGYKTLQKKYGLNFNRGSKRQCFWATPKEHQIHIGYLDWSLETLYGIDGDWMVEHLGKNWVDLPPAVARDRILEWADRINQLLSEQAIADGAELPG